MGNDARGSSRHKDFCRLHASHRCFQIGNILLYSRLVFPGNGADTRRTGPGRAPVALHRLRKIGPVGAHGYLALASEPGEAVLDIRGIGLLSLLASVVNVPDP